MIEIWAAYYECAHKHRSEHLVKLSYWQETFFFFFYHLHLLPIHNSAVQKKWDSLGGLQLHFVAQTN